MSVRVAEKHKGSGEWYVYAESHGQRRAKRIGQGKDALGLARQLAKKWGALLALGQDAEVFTKPIAAVASGEGPRLGDALLDWISAREKSGDLRGGSPAAYRGAARTWILPHALPDGRALGDLPVSQISREHLGALIARIKKAGRSRSTVEHARNALRGFFRDLVERKVLSVNPAADLSYFVGKMKQGKRAAFFSVAECSTLLQAAEGTRLHAFVATALGTGARWGELVALTRDDVDLKGARLHITKSFSPKSGKVESTKTDKVRAVPISSALVEVLGDWFKTRSAEGWGPDAIVFPTASGRHQRNIQEAWTALLERAKIPYRKFHTTRHTFASHALKAAIRPELVQKWLGHATLTMTLNTYGHFVPDSAGDAADAEKLGNLLQG